MPASSSAYGTRYTPLLCLIFARGRRHSRRKVDQAGHAPVLRLECRQSLLDLPRRFAYKAFTAIAVVGSTSRST